MVAPVSNCAPSIFDVIPSAERPGLAIVGSAEAATTESETPMGEPSTARSGEVLRSLLRRGKKNKTNKSRKGVQHEDFPGGSPILVLLSPKHA